MTGCGRGARIGILEAAFTPREVYLPPASCRRTDRIAIAGLRPVRSGVLVLILTVAVLSPAPASAQFVDRTAERGLLWYQSTWGAALVDLDLDGDLDLYSGHHFFDPILYWNDGTGTFDPNLHPAPWLGFTDRHGVLAVPLGTDRHPDLFLAHGADGGSGSEQNELYRNDGDGSFISLLGAGGMGDPLGRSRAASAADFDGDHVPDVWVGKAPDATSFNSLFRGTGPYQFTDVAAAAGIDEGLGTVGGIWGDYDGDDDPDLLVGGEEFGRPTVLWRNDGGTFSDASGVFSPSLPIVSGADWGDYDLDGDLDLAVCDGGIGIFDTWADGDSLTFFFNTRYADTGVDGLTVAAFADTVWASLRIRAFEDTSRIFLGPSEVNPPSGSPIALTDAFAGAPTFTPGVDRGIWVWRQRQGGAWEVRCSTPLVGYDAFDGWLAQSAPISHTVEHDLEDPGFVSGTVRVWRNDGGSFLEVTGALGLPTEFVNPRDVSWVDWDNDGDLDLHVVDMGTSAKPNASDALLRNDGATFADVTGAQGLGGGTTGMGDGAVWGDVDGDGDLDVYLQEGAGPAAFSAFGPARLFVNEGSHGPSLQITLTGRVSGEMALGTRVTVVAGSLRITRTVTANSWRGFQDPGRLHFGLGGAAEADSVILDWSSGTSEIYLSVPAGIYSWAEDENPTFGPPAPGPSSLSPWKVSPPWPQPARGPQFVRISAVPGTPLAGSVHDVSGRLVRALRTGPVDGPEVRVEWDGRDDAGRWVPAGVYWYRFTDGTRTSVRRSVRLR